MTMKVLDDNCPLCGKEPLTELHRESENHRFNYLLEEWNSRRKGLVSNRHNVEIETKTDQFEQHVEKFIFHEKQGKYITNVQQEQLETINNEITHTFLVVNKRNDSNVLLTHCDTLHPLKNFQLIDTKGHMKKGEVVELTPGAKYKVQVKFNGDILGEFRMAVGFSFLIKKGEKKDTFTIAREIIIIIKNKFGNEARLSGKSPFSGEEWHYKGTRSFPAIGGRRSVIDHPVPYYQINIYKYGFDSNHLKHEDYVHAKIIEDVLNRGPTPNNYNDYHNFLLWMDEVGAQIKIEKYNMEEVPIWLFREQMIQLDVPGLGEKRPSLVVMDEICIRIKNEIFGGIIRHIEEETIKIIGVHRRLIEMVRNAPDGILLADIKFTVGRLPYLRKHNAVSLCCYEEKMNILFPKISDQPPNKQYIEIKEFVNPLVAKNQHQMAAVTNIVNNTSGVSPFVVFGPPGTGKTITIVEAIVQITKLHKNPKILICAPTNAACDMLTLKLIRYFKRTELIRIHSENCDWSTVSDEIKEYSNRGGEVALKYSGKDLSKFKVVIMTLVFAGKYAGNSFPRTHVFVDEAAQALESEAVISIGGILVNNGQFVLAGDPKQLAPLTNSNLAIKYGFNISLMERLMKMEMYQPVNNNSNYIVKLKHNYRSHEKIIHIPNHLFYDSELEAVSQEAKNDPINKVKFPVDRHKIKAQPVEFYGASGEEEKDGNSPSYFNRTEIRIVMQYVKLLLESNCSKKILPEQIGIITPYTRQVMKIRRILESEKIKGIEVGTTEAFQGREKRVIIISTVRAKADLLLHDKKYKLGFVENERRFNTAITRAMSKLIIIGNPHVLCYSKYWIKMIRYCQNLDSFRGCYFAERNLKLKDSIVKKFGFVSIMDSQYKGQHAKTKEDKRKKGKISKKP